jgi:hypothetical protein
MQTAPSTTAVLDPTQLRRIEAMHSGFLYQHLYGVACLLMAAPLGWTRMFVEHDEDLELQYEDRRTYVQVKTRSSVVQPSDVSGALDRFEQYRQEHAANNRAGRADFVLALNANPSPALAARITAGQIPSDVRVVWPGHAVADLPPPWTDVDEAFAWCVARAEALPFVMVAPDVLVLKLAGAMLRISSGSGEFSSHAVTAQEAAGMLEQFVHQLHEFPAPPPNYMPQDHEPALTTTAPVRLIVGFSGAGKTSWAAQCAMVDERASTYLDVADLPSSSVSAALARELAARWLHSNPRTLQAVDRAALSGVEALHAVGKLLAEQASTYTIVVDNAHRLAVRDSRSIAESLRGLRLVLLAQPTADLSQLATALAVAPETLQGWGVDTIASEASAGGCGATMSTISRLRSLTAGLPLYVHSAIQVAKGDFGGDLVAFCEALESQTLPVDTAQHIILSRVFDGLTTQVKQVLACASLADIPLAADELVAIASAAFGLGHLVVVSSLRSLRASGLLQAYGSQRSKVHDAMRPIALGLLAGAPAEERRAKEELLSLLEHSLWEKQEKDRFPLFVRMLVDLRRVEVLADLATEEAFHEVGVFPMVWPVLEEAARDTAIPPETRFECLDALLYYRQRVGPRETVAPLLAAMEAVLTAGLKDSRAQLVFLQKSVVLRAEQGDEAGVHNVLRLGQQLLPPGDDASRRVFAYHAALAFWKLKQFSRAEKMLRPLLGEYLRMLQLDVETLRGDAAQYLERARQDDSYSIGCKHLADCFDLMARICEALGRPPGAARAVASRLFEVSGSWDSAARLCIDLVWQYLDAGEAARARKTIEGGLLTLVTTYGLTDRVIPVRFLYAHTLGKTGDVEAARNELRAIDPFLSSLPAADQKDAISLTAFLR